MPHPPYLPHDLGSKEALDFTIAFLDGAPDEETVATAALFIGEPLVDWHWLELEGPLVQLMKERRDLRRLVRACVFGATVPVAVADRLYMASRQS